MSPSLERRQYKRYWMDLLAQLKVRKESKFVDTGDGRVRNVSRDGVFFECNVPIPPGTALRLIIEWPVRFERKTRIDWIVDGLVVRSTPFGAALSIMRQRFERVGQSHRKKMAS